jgi:hypothetical protein
MYFILGRFFFLGVFTLKKKEPAQNNPLSGHSHKGYAE